MECWGCIKMSALSPNSANKLLIESELEKINRRNLLKAAPGNSSSSNNNNQENNKVELGNNKNTMITTLLSSPCVEILSTAPHIK